MAIYLDSQTRSHLERRYKTVHETDFIGKRIQGMLEADRRRLSEVDNCDHITGEFVGRKVCCVKCGAMIEEGHSTFWLNKELSEEQKGE